MASPGNLNQPGGPFDVHKFFKPPTSPNSQNPATNFSSSSPFPPSPYPPPPSASYPPPPGAYSQFHHPQFAIPPYSQPDHNHLTNFHHQRSAQPPSQHLPLQNPNAGAKLMALLSSPPSTFDSPQQPLAPIQRSPGSSEYSIPPNVPVLPSAISAPNLIPSAMGHSPPKRMPSRKLPKGRHLIGDYVVYDIDVRFEGEVQPQLEVTPITKYISDPGLVLGRQIAVSKTYICYGLKMGAIRVLNINTALRSLLKGLSQRITDMAFFAEDVHLLASASADGRIYIWKIAEGSEEEDKPQITGQIVIAIQVVGEAESVHPRVCWHCHKQEILVVGIGKRILKIDTTKVGRSEVYSAEEPLKCPIDSLINGVQDVGKHEGEVTDLSMCQWMTTRLVSASTDGTIKIWEDRKAQPLAVLRPHDGQPVNSVTFLTSPHRPDHIILITAGPLNREVKIWTSASEEGWLLPSDAESWNCTQTLDLRSSAESRAEEAFFNQLMAFSQSGLLLLANAKKNAIYAVHLEYGPYPAATRMDYIAEFTVTMPILSLTGTSDLLANGEQVIQIYCVQTQAIQQYALDLSQCLPPTMEHAFLEKSDSGVIRDIASGEGSALESSGSKPAEIPLAWSISRPSMPYSGSESVSALRCPMTSASMEATTSVEFANLSMESRRASLPTVSSNHDIPNVASPSLPPSPGLSRKLSGFRSPTNDFEPAATLDDRGEDLGAVEYSAHRQMDNVPRSLSNAHSVDDGSGNNGNKAIGGDISTIHNHPMKFKHPTHLVTPSEILMAASSSESTHITEQKNEEEPNMQDVVVNSDVHNVEVEVKVVGETGFTKTTETGYQAGPYSFVPENNERTFCSQASDLGIKMARESRALSSEVYIVEESRPSDGANLSEELTQSSNAEEEVHGSTKDISKRTANSVMSEAVPQHLAPTTKGKRQKGRIAQGSGPPSPPAADSAGEPFVGPNIPSMEAVFSQIMTTQDMINQLTSVQKEMQKQMSTMVAVPVTKEGRRLEVVLGKSMEKAVKANSDALWARFQEENVKQEKLLRERVQQITNLITNFTNKDLPTIVEKTVKKELAVVGPAVARTVSPIIEKTVATAIAEVFQRGIGDKAVNQLERSVNSKLEATVARQIQAQFQTSGRQALQDALKSCLEASIIPAFEMSCRAMFEQVDATFQKGTTEHASAAQQQFESTHSSLALALRDAVNSALSIAQTLSGELADGQRKLLALTNSKTANPSITQLNNGPLGCLHDKIETPLDPTTELSRLISERKYEEAFTAALQRSDVSIVSWLCFQVDLQGILSMVPVPLSQGVLLSLLQQLACDIAKDTPRKLTWMKDVAVAINPVDPMIAMHIRPIFEQVYQILNHHRSLSTTSSADLSNIRLVMHVINSILMTCK
ncbi:hypothetical protein NMG60_11037455 [Bertholletia excelsa]